MAIHRVLVAAVGFLSCAGSAAAQVSAPTTPVDFQREVRPILADNCFACHGPDQGARQARLRLDTEDGAFAERQNGATIARGDAAVSLLIQRITHENEHRRMPPLASSKTLSADQIALLCSAGSTKARPGTSTGRSSQSARRRRPPWQTKPGCVTLSTDSCSLDSRPRVSHLRPKPTAGRSPDAWRSLSRDCRPTQARSRAS